MSVMDPGPAPNPLPQPDYLMAPPGPTSVVTSPPPRDPGYTRRLTAAVVVAIILATGGGIGVGWNLAHLISSHNTATLAPIRTVTPVSPSPGTGAFDAAAVAARVSPSVVDVNTTIQTASGTGEAAGTGLILTPTGDILTNNHVVEGANDIQVSIQGRSGTYSAQVIGVDPSEDIAVIHINGVSGLPTVTLADTSALKIGDTVLAIGNALGLGGAPRVTQGSITALNQMITALGPAREDVGYNATFWYPRQGGIEALVRGLLADVTPLGEVRTGARVERIDLERRRLRLASGEEIPYQQLVLTKQIVDTMEGDDGVQRDPFLFGVLLRVKDEKNLKATEHAVVSDVSNLARGRVDPSRLAAIKSNVRYENIKQLDKPDAIADTLARYTTLTGDLDYINALYRELDAVRPEDLVAFTKKALLDANRTTINLVTGAGNKPRPVARSGKGATK